MMKVILLCSRQTKPGNADPRSSIEASRKKKYSVDIFTKKEHRDTSLCNNHLLSTRLIH